MPIANVAARGGQTYAALGTSSTFTITTPLTVAVGNTIFLFLACDNSLAGGAGQLIQASWTLTPTAGSWIPLGTITNNAGAAANTGVQLYVWACKVLKPLNAAETVTISCGASIGRAVASAREFSGVFLRSAPDNRVTNTGNAGTTATAAGLTHSAAGDLVLGLAGVESNAAITGDADVTDGAWNTSNNAASNSGTAATSISSISQYKITTGTASQSFDVTWTGAADWAAMTIVVPAAVTPTIGNPQENPNYPCVAGPEYLPVRDAPRLVDTGTGYNVQFTFPDSSNNQTAFRANAAFINPNARSQHTVSFEFMDEGRYSASLSDDVTSVVLPLRSAWVRNPLSGLDTTATDIVGTSLDPDTYPGGGAAAIAYIVDSLTSAGGNYVKFDTNTARPYIGLYFDPTILNNFVGHRIMRVGLRYLAWKDDGSPATLGEGFAVGIGDTQTVRVANTTGAEFSYGNWLTPDYARNADYQTRWLGETNHISRGNFDPNGQNYMAYQCHPFTLVDLNRMANGVEQFYVSFTGQPGYDLLQTVTYLDYCEMVVELAPERRVLVSNRVVSNLVPSTVGDYGFDATNDVLMHSALNAELVTPLNFSGDNSVFTVRQAFPATPSDRYRVDPDGSFGFTFAEAMGSSLEMYGIQQIRPFYQGDYPQFFETVLVDGLPDFNTLQTVDYVYSALMYDAISYGIYGPFWIAEDRMSYPTFRWAGVVSGVGTYTVDQTIMVPGGQQYDRIRVLCKPDITQSAALTLSIEQPLATPIATATITVADWEAAGADFQLGSEVDYREVIVDLSVPITPSAGNVYVVGSSLATSPWDVATAHNTLNGDFSYEWFEDDLNDPDDHAIVLLCPIPQPNMLIEDEVIDNSQDGAPCTATELTVAKVTVDNADEFDVLVFTRSIDGGNTEVVVQHVNVEGAPTIEWIDYGTPWDVQNIVYFVYGYRSSDHSVNSNFDVYTGPTTAPGAAFGLVDYLNGDNYIYTPVSDSELEIQWSPLNPISMVQLHGIDFNVALRSPEERGLAVSVVVAVRNFSKCSDDEVEIDGEILAAGQKSMSPIPFDRLRFLENQCRLQLNLPGGHTRWVSLDLGTMTVRTVHGVYLAEITLTDITLLEQNPYDD